MNKGALTRSSIEFENLKSEAWEIAESAYARRWMHRDGRVLNVLPNINEQLNTDQSLANGYHQEFTIAYIAAPWPFTSVEPIDATELNTGENLTGQWYEISDVGDGNVDWDAIGRVDGNVGDQFNAVTVSNYSGLAYETVDRRILPSHQEHLKYAAAAFLLNMQGDQQSIALADKYMATFNALVK